MARDGVTRLWCNIGETGEIGGILEALGNVLARMPELSVMLTAGRAVEMPPTLPDRIEIVPKPYDLTQIVDRFLTDRAPDVALLSGADLSPSVISACRKRGVPMLLVNARFHQRGALQQRLADFWMGSRLRAFEHIFAVAGDDAEYLVRKGAPVARVEVLGKLESVPSAPTCDESEREYLSGCLAARPVWLAAGLPEDELSAIEVAYRAANRQAHRLLLVVTPADLSHGAAFARFFEDGGWITARREEGEEPDLNVQVFIADAPDEAGLWYRLAPITFLGGTFTGAAFNDPYEPAALGSAVLHGTALALPSRHLEALAAAAACRAVADAGDLGAAVGDLLSPDRNATMAARAWEVTFRGAEAALRVGEVLTSLLRERSA